MYDNHIYCEQYKELKDFIIDIMNGEDVEYDLEELKNHVHELYGNMQLQATQYDDLMSYLDEL